MNALHQLSYSARQYNEPGIVGTERESIDWFTLICGLILGLVVGGMLGLSFANFLVPA